MHTIAPTQATAALELSHAAQNNSLAAGAIFLAVGWTIHHKSSHRHKIWDILAAVLLASGAVLLVIGVDSFARWVQAVNGWSATAITDILGWFGITGWPHWCGALTVLEFILLPWMAFFLWDKLRAKPGGRGGGGSGTLARKQWDRLEDRHLQRWGMVAAGPLTVVLPAPLGPLCAIPFASLAAFAGNLFATWTGGK